MRGKKIDFKNPVGKNEDLLLERAGKFGGGKRKGKM